MTGEIFQSGVPAALPEDLYPFPAATQSSVQLSRAPAPGDLMCSPGLQKHPHPCDDKHRHRHININRNKSPLKIN